MAGWSKPNFRGFRKDVEPVEDEIKTTRSLKCPYVITFDYELVQSPAVKNMLDLGKVVKSGFSLDDPTTKPKVKEVIKHINKETDAKMNPTPAISTKAEWLALLNNGILTNITNDFKAFKKPEPLVIKPTKETPAIKPTIKTTDDPFEAKRKLRNERMGLSTTSKVSKVNKYLSQHGAELLRSFKSSEEIIKVNNNQYPQGTEIVNGIPYWPAFNQDGSPWIDPQSGTQCYTDGRNIFVFDRPAAQAAIGQQPWQNSNNRAPVVNNSAGNWNTNNRAANSIVVNSNFNVKDEWDSGKASTPAATRPVVTATGGKPKVNNVPVNDGAATTNPWTGDEKQPFPITFNPNTHSLKRVSRDGAVVYDTTKLPKVLTMQELNFADDWSYLRNELDPRARMRYRHEALAADNRRNTGDSPYLSLSSTLTRKNVAELPVGEDYSGNAIILTETPYEVVGSTWNAVSNEVRNLATKLNIDKTQTLIANIIAGESYTLDKETTGYFKDILSANNLSVLALKMRTFLNTGKGDIHVFNAVDAYLTGYINEWIRYTVGVSGSITNVADGCEELVFDLSKVGGKLVVDAVTRTNEAFTERMLDCFEFTDQEDGSSVMTIKRNGSMVISPFTFAEFEIGIIAEKGYGIINPNTHKEAFSIFSNVLGANDADPRDDVVVVTADGKIVRFISSALIKGSVLAVLATTNIF